MTRPKEPGPWAVDGILQSLARIGGAAVCVVCPDDAEAAALSKRMGDRLVARLGHVRGNRADKSAVTWDDLRLLLAGELRDLADMLDTPDATEDKR